MVSRTVTVSVVMIVSSLVRTRRFITPFRLESERKDPETAAKKIVRSDDWRIAGMRVIVGQ
jgi:hypothetical protein